MTIIKKILIRLLSVLPSKLDRISVLMYHSVSDSEALFAVSAKAFEKQMRYIHDGGFTTIFASEIIPATSAKNTVCITFDDGYADMFTNAFPILTKYRMKATVFLITNELGGSYTNSEGLTFPLLTREQIMEMRESGIIEFMPHGHTHRKFSGMTEEEQERDIVASRDIVHELTGRRADVFAYPRGKRTATSATLLAKHGYTMALGVRPGLVRKTSDPYLLPRNAVDKQVTFSEFKLKVSDYIQWYASVTGLWRDKHI